ncbi:hypothetical protein V3851_05530 [Paenibacillus sp. M1]|uniref:SH3 domain-containing protein n=1 Tax=Paenibacillus haidiansis TaxID=1574488 RepID=A0ABU7VNF7_9BACL
MKQLKGLAASGLAFILALAPVAAGAVYAGAPQDTQIKQTPEATKDPNAKHHHPRHVHGGHIVKDTAALLGVPPKSIVEQLKQGKSLLQVVQTTKGWSEDEYLKKLTEKASQNIDQAVAEGKIDKEKAAKIKADLPERLKKMIHRTWKDKSPGHPTIEYHTNHINWANP